MNKRLSLALLSLFFFGASHLSANLPARSIGASIERSKLSTEIVKRLISYDGSDQRIDCQALSEQYPALLTPEDVKNMIITLGKKLGRTVAQFQGHPLLLSSVGYIPSKNYKKAAKRLFRIIVAKRLLQERDQEPLEIDCRRQPGAFDAHLKTDERVKIANFFALIFRRNITCILDPEQDGAASSSVAHSEPVHPIIALPQNQGGAKSNSAVAAPSQPTATRTLPAAEPEPAQIIPVVQHPPLAQDKPVFYQELTDLIVAGKILKPSGFARTWKRSSGQKVTKQEVLNHAQKIAKTLGKPLLLYSDCLADSLQELDNDLTKHIRLLSTGGETFNATAFAKTWKSKSGKTTNKQTVWNHAQKIAAALNVTLKSAQKHLDEATAQELDKELTKLVSAGDKTFNASEFARTWKSASNRAVTKRTVLDHAKKTSLAPKQDSAASSSVARTEPVHPRITLPQNQGCKKSNSAAAAPSQPTATRTLPASEPEPAQIIPVVQHPPSAQDKPAFYQELIDLIRDRKKLNITALAEKWGTSRYLVKKHAEAIAKTLNESLELSRKRLDDDSLKKLDEDLTRLLSADGEIFNASAFARTWKNASCQMVSDQTVRNHAQKIKDSLLKSSQKRLSTEGQKLNLKKTHAASQPNGPHPATNVPNAPAAEPAQGLQLLLEAMRQLDKDDAPVVSTAPSATK